MEVRRLYRTLLLACLLGWANLAGAELVQKLYDAELLVADQRAELRPALLTEGLRQVMVRVSGQHYPEQNPAIAAALSNPQPLLSQYNFRRDRGDDGQTRLSLVMQFSPRQVNATLQSAGLPVWSANRPGVLVWMMVDTAAGRRFLSADSPSPMLAALREQAYRRGLALQFPLLDLEDRSRLSAEGLWLLSEQEVRAASQRYRPAYVLMGKATELSSGDWLASWGLLESETIRRLDSQGFSPNEVLAPVIDALADSQAQQYALVGGGQLSSATLIEVQGLGTFSNYAQMSQYLEGLAVIKHANVIWAQGEVMVLELVLNDSFDKAQRFLSLDGRMQPLPVLDHVDSPRAGLLVQARYRWQGQ